MTRSLFSFPIFLATAMVTAGALFFSPTAKAEEDVCGLVTAPFEGWYGEFCEECVGYQFQYLVYKYYVCEGCCIRGPLSIYCNTTHNYLVNLCADCEDTNFEEFPCPSGGTVLAFGIHCGECDTED